MKNDDVAVDHLSGWLNDYLWRLLQLPIGSRNNLKKIREKMRKGNFAMLLIPLECLGLLKFTKQNVRNAPSRESQRGMLHPLP